LTLFSKIKSLNLNLNNEIDEKNGFKEKISELNEELYIEKVKMKSLFGMHVLSRLYRDNFI